MTSKVKSPSSSEDDRDPRGNVPACFFVKETDESIVGAETPGPSGFRFKRHIAESANDERLDEPLPERIPIYR